MADTTVLTPAQIAALADTGASVPVTVNDTRRFAGASLTLYTSDSAAPGGVAPWVRLQVGSFSFDGPLASVAGAARTNAITNAEALAFVATAKKLFAGLVL